jgi:2-oxo-hept-3-ene-1,7-dioate hydratase
MLSEADRLRAVDLLLEAERTRTPVVQLSKTFPEIEILDSYAISAEVTRRKMAGGARLIGHKIGLTSKAMQQSSQVDEPDFGHLLDTMLIPDGAKIRHADYCVPRVEPELAFVLGRPLKGPGVTLVDVLRATDYVVPAIEIIDARVQNPRRITDTVADNGAAAGIVLGGRPVGPMDVDLRWVGAVFYRNSGIEETGLAAGVLGHPALAIAWLANKVGPFGTELAPGHILLSGSFTRPIWADPGDTLHADFGPLGGVAVQFV